MAHVVAAHPSPGGVSATVDALLAAAEERGRPGSVVTYRPGGSGLVDAIGIRDPVRLPLPLDPLLARLAADRSVDRVLLHGCFTPLAARASTVLRRLRPDITILGYPHDPYGPELFGTRAALKELYWKAFEKRYLDRIDAVVISVAGHEEFLRRRGVRTPTVIASPGLSSTDVRQADLVRARRPAVVGSPPVWLVLGRWDVYEKGLDLLLSAFATQRARLGGARLRLVGPELGARGDLERLATAAGLTAGPRASGSDVELIGWVDDAWSEIAGATALLMPSRKEGFGLAGLQGLASGIPLLISSAAGLADVIGTRPGVITARPDAADLERALGRLAGDTAELASAAIGTGGVAAATMTSAAQLSSLEDWTPDPGHPARRRPGLSER